MLLPSSSVTLGVPDEKSDGATSDVAVLLPILSAFFCWISFDMRSAGRASITFSATVGNSSKTVIVQSSWFCWNLLRRLCLVNKRSLLSGAMGAYFSFAILSLATRSRVSLIFEMMY